MGGTFLQLVHETNPVTCITGVLSGFLPPIQHCLTFNHIMLCVVNGEPGTNANV